MEVVSHHSITCLLDTITDGNEENCKLFAHQLNEILLLQIAVARRFPKKFLVTVGNKLKFCRISAKARLLFDSTY